MHVPAMPPHPVWSEALQALTAPPLLSPSLTSWHLNHQCGDASQWSGVVSPQVLTDEQQPY